MLYWNLASVRLSASSMEFAQTPRISGGPSGIRGQDRFFLTACGGPAGTLVERFDAKTLLGELEATCVHEPSVSRELP